MNRHDRRKAIKEQHTFVKTLPDRLLSIDPNEFKHTIGKNPPMAAWRSRHYLVMLFPEGEGLKRLSVCRSMLKSDGRWEDGITWDELQRIKLETVGDVYALEVYPQKIDEINVANMRHLWIMERPMRIGWFHR